MIARLSSLVVWGLVALAAVAWGLRMGSRGTPVPSHAAVAEAAAPAGMDLSRVLGTPPAAPVEQAPVPVAESRFRLIGVVAPRGGRADGVAVIAVDGQPPRTLRQGREVEPGLVLKTIGHRRVELVGDGRAPVVLELPPLAEAQRGRPGEGGSPSAVPRAAGLPVPAQQPPGMAPGMVPGMPSPGMPAAGVPTAEGVPGAVTPAPAPVPAPAGYRPTGAMPGGQPPAPVVVDAPAEPAPGTR